MFPLAARAQQPAMPAIGYLSTSFPNAAWVASFRQGLKEAGYIEGQNVAIEFRWAEGQYDRLPGLAADLVARQVAVIAALGHPAALAAKSVTAAIPIVFMSVVDPVAYGLVDSIDRPGGNATGAYLPQSLEAKRLELLRAVFPNAALAALVNPTNPAAEQQLKDTHAAARALGIELRIVKASTEPSIDSVFASLVEQRIGALLVTPDSFFAFRRDQIVALAASHAMPAM
jgi:putative ABC transport system substrate-binding protein